MLFIFLIGYNVASISGVHYRDNANLCNKFHIAYRAYRNYAAHDMIIQCYVFSYFVLFCLVTNVDYPPERLINLLVH